MPGSNGTDEKAGLEAVAGNRSTKAPAPVCPALVVPGNYTPDGEPPRSGKPISHYVRSPRSLEKPQKERVLILAANSGGSCALQLGDYYTFLSLLDKLQYGNVHGYDVLLGLGNVDDDLRKTWNKVAWMQKVHCQSHGLHSVQTACSLQHIACFVLLACISLPALHPQFMRLAAHSLLLSCWHAALQHRSSL